MELMEEKWRTLFKMFDLTHDKQIARDDLDINKNIFINFYNLKGDEAASVKSQLDKYWDGIILHGLETKPEISENEFVDNFKKSFSNDKEKTRKLIRESNDNLLKIADRNNDGFISLDELFAIYKAWNLGNEKLVKILFELIGPNEDQLCTLESVSDFCTEFIIGESKEKFDAMKKGFESAGIPLDSL